MALVLARLQSMAAFSASARGKRKAASPLPIGAQVVDLISDDDEPISKRHKSQSVEDNSEDDPLNKFRLRVDQPLVNRQKERTAKPSTPAALDHTRAAAVRLPSQQSSSAARTSSTHVTSTTPNGPVRTQPPSEWEKKINANGKAYYVNHRTKKTAWHLPSSGSSTNKHLSASATNTPTFRLPHSQPIKFEATSDPSPSGITGKQQVYDVEKVKTFFQGSSPKTSITNPKSSQSIPNEDGRIKRQSQRETKAPERLVVAPKPLKAIDFPSRTMTPTLPEIQSKTYTLTHPRFSVVIPAAKPKPRLPAVDHEADQLRKQALFREMKVGVSVVSKRAKSVERYFGATGFSATYGIASDDERQKQIHGLQSKVKKVKRRNIQLEWGDDLVVRPRPFDHKKLIHPKDQIKVITKSTTLSITARAPITFVNDVDDRQLNGKFQFISEYVVREGVKRQQSTSQLPVSCGDTCAKVCSLGTCACMQNREMQILNGAPVPTYRIHHSGPIVLNETFIRLTKENLAKTEIVECNNNCRCDRFCFNRVVQRGRNLPLEIFMTGLCGFGVRCPQDIVKGQFVDVYLGELVTDMELKKREAAQDDGEPSYDFALDWFNVKLNSVHYQIDGSNFGSPMRFLNHSCNPNCAVFPVMLKEYDQNIYGLAFFAIKDIPAMQELTIDYQPQLNAPQLEPDDDDDDEDAADASSSKVTAKCQCGEKNCRGFIWPNAAKSTRPRRRGI